MNIRPHIILNGVDSSTVEGLIITELPPITKPPIRTLIDVIDGRDGDIVTELGYSAYDRVVKIGLTYNYNLDKIIDYFNGNGWVIFSNEPDRYYLYGIYNQIDFERLIRFKTAEITLHVQPFKYPVTEIPITETNLGQTTDIAVYNSGNIYSRPKITITASGDVVLSINGFDVLSIEFGETAQTIIIDCDKMNAYSLDNVLLNRLVTGNYDKIKLEKGNNSLYVEGGGIAEITIEKYTRWI